MADNFDIVGKMVLKAPPNLNAVAKQLQDKLGNINANVNIKLDSGLSSNIGSIQKGLNALNSTMRATVATGGDLSAMFRGLTGSVKAFAQAANTGNKTKDSLDSTGRSARKAKDDFSTLNGQIDVTVRRFSAFVIVAQTFNSVFNSAKSAIDETIKYQGELVKLKQVGGDSAATIKGVSDEIVRLSTSFGVSSQKLIEAASTLRQAGLSADETKKSLEALAKASLAPSFTDFKNATEGLIAVTGQFGVKAQDYLKVLGEINAVSNKYAVESNDLVTAVRTAGASFVQAGGSLEEFLGIFTSIRQATREAPETIATGLKTIFASLQNKDVVKNLASLGVHVRDIKGDLIPTIDIFGKLNTLMLQLGEHSQAFETVLEQIGGKRQIGRLIPGIKEFQTAVEAANVAKRGGNSLDIASVQAQEKLEVQLTKVKEEFLSIFKILSDDATVKKFIGQMLDLAKSLTEIAKALSPLIGPLAILGTLKAANVAGGVGRSIIQQSFGIKRAGGGPVNGPGPKKVDSINAVLAPKEYIIQSDAVEYYGQDLMDKINKRKIQKKNLELADGGNMIQSLDDFKQHFASGGRVHKDDRDNIGTSLPQGGFFNSQLESELADAFLEDQNKTRRKPVRTNIDSKAETIINPPSKTNDINREFFSQPRKRQVVQEVPKNIDPFTRFRNINPRQPFFGDDELSDIANFTNVNAERPEANASYLNSQKSSVSHRVNDIIPFADTTKTSQPRTVINADRSRTQNILETARNRPYRAKDLSPAELQKETNDPRNLGPIFDANGRPKRFPNNGLGAPNSIPNNGTNVQNLISNSNKSNLDKYNKAVDDITQIFLQEKGVLNKRIKSEEDYIKYQEALGQAQRDAKKAIQDNVKVVLNQSGGIGGVIKQKKELPFVDKDEINPFTGRSVSDPRGSYGPTKRKAQVAADDVISAAGNKPVSTNSPEGASPAPGGRFGKVLTGAAILGLLGPQIFGDSQNKGLLGTGGTKAGVVAGSVSSGAGTGLAISSLIGGRSGAGIGAIVGFTTAVAQAQKELKELAINAHDAAISEKSKDFDTSSQGFFNDKTKKGLDSKSLGDFEGAVSEVQKRREANTGKESEVNFDPVRTIRSVFDGGRSEDERSKKRVADARQSNEEAARPLAERAESVFRTRLQRGGVGDFNKYVGSQEGKSVVNAIGLAGNKDPIGQLKNIFDEFSKQKKITDVVDKVNYAFAKTVASLEKFSRSVEHAGENAEKGFKQAQFGLSASTGNGGSLPIKFGVSTLGPKGQQLNDIAGRGGQIEQAQGLLPEILQRAKQSREQYPTLYGGNIAKFVEHDKDFSKLGADVQSQTKNAFHDPEEAARLEKRITSGDVSGVTEGILKNFDPVKEAFNKIRSELDKVGADFIHGLESLAQNTHEIGQIQDTASSNRGNQTRFRAEAFVQQSQVAQFTPIADPNRISATDALYGRQGIDRDLSATRVPAVSAAQAFGFGSPEFGTKGNFGKTATDLLSVNQLRAPLAAQQRRLTGLSGGAEFNADAVGAKLAENKAGLAQAQNDFVKNQDSNPTAAANAAKRVVDFQNQIGNNIQALKTLQDTTQTTAAAQEKLARVNEKIEGDQRSRLSFGESQLFKSPQERRQTAKNQNLAQIALAQGHLGGFNDKQAQGAITALNELGETQIQTGVDKRGRATFDTASNAKNQLLINSGLTGANDSRNPLFAEQKALNGQVQNGFGQADKASQILTDNLTKSNDVFLKKMEGILENFFGKPVIGGQTGNAPTQTLPTQLQGPKTLKQKRFGDSAVPGAVGPDDGVTAVAGAAGGANSMFAPLTEALPTFTEFSNTAKLLADSFNNLSIPSEINLKYNGTVDVRINGTDFLGDIGKMIETKVNEAIASKLTGQKNNEVGV
jgi:TP901 family phage tail tape measure protein